MLCHGWIGGYTSEVGGGAVRKGYSDQGERGYDLINRHILHIDSSVSADGLNRN